MLSLDSLKQIHQAGAELLEKVSNRQTQLCPVCGEPMQKHLRCSYCGILIGRFHIEPHLTDKACGNCYPYREVRR